MKNENKKNIVIVADDDLFIRKLIRSALKDFAEVIDVADGAEVLKAYKQHNPDILFLDYHLPNLTGLELLPLILNEDSEAHVIMLSADSSTTNVLQTHEAGSKGFITKPFTSSRLLEVVRLCPTIRFADA